MLPTKNSVSGYLRLRRAGGEHDVRADRELAVREDIDQLANVAAGQRLVVVGEADVRQVEAALPEPLGHRLDGPHLVIVGRQPALALHAPPERG